MAYSPEDFDRLSLVRDALESVICARQDKIAELSEDIVRLRLEIDCIEHCLEEFSSNVRSIHED